MPQVELKGSARSLLAGLPSLAPTFLVVGLMACVLVPLPTLLVDLLLSLSLAGSIVLLVASLRVERTSEFLSFPSLLLLVTLFRLALNISTTRLILSQADAGQVIDAFSGIVVRNDLIVGGVLFAIITAVQYLVIARGTERVAEVGARFALDGMPGNQAAIDADLRSGSISPREASRRRARLMERSNFYGAMDGAVRFVKGDAIAGLVIIAINLAGGLAIGVGRQGLDFGESLNLYGRLTIGDGLMAQIPALLVSLAAGVLVARVDRETETDRRWLEPAMLVVPAVLLGGLALVPGMPWLAFLSTALGLLASAMFLASRRPASQGAVAPDEITIALAGGLGGKHPNRLISGLQGRCEAALGFGLPGVAAATFDDLEADYEIRLGERVLGRGSVGGEGEDAVVLELYRCLMRSGPELIDLEWVHREIERVRGTRAGVCKAALSVMRADEILVALRSIVSQRIPLPPMEAVLTVIAEDPAMRNELTAVDKGRRSEWIRERTASFWLHEVLAGVARLGELEWIRPTPDLAEELRGKAHADEEGTVLDLSQRQREHFVGLLVPADVTNPIVLCDPQSRPAVAAVLRTRVPHTVVLSTRELDAIGHPLPKDARWVDLA